MLRKRENADGTSEYLFDDEDTTNDPMVRLHGTDEFPPLLASPQQDLQLKIQRMQEKIADLEKRHSQLQNHYNRLYAAWAQGATTNQNQQQVIARLTLLNHSLFAAIRKAPVDPQKAASASDTTPRIDGSKF